MYSVNVFIAANKPENNKPSAILLSLLLVRFCSQPMAEDLSWQSELQEECCP